MPDTTTSSVLDLLFDDDRVGRCLVAPDGRVLRANAEWLRSTGLRLDEVLGANIIDLFPNDRVTTLAMHARARAGHRVEVPRHAVRIHGIETWWESSIAPVPMDGGTGLLITALEVIGQAAPRADAAASVLADYLYDVGPAGIVLYEPTPPFRVLVTNKAYQDMWPEPLRSRGLVGLGLTEYVRDAEERGIAEIFREVARTGLARTLEEFAYEGFPGGTRWFNWTLSPVLRDGRVVALSHMAADITREVRARKVAEEAVVESRHAAELLELGDPFCELDREFRIIRVNAAHERINGHRREEILGRTHWDVWPESALPSSPYWHEYHRCMAERVRVEFDAYYPPLDVWTSVIAYPTDEGGIAIFWRDVSERKRVEQERERLLAQVQVERDRISALVASMKDEVWFADTERRFTLLNPAVVKEFELSGKLGGADIEEVAASLEVLRPDGSPRPAREAPALRALEGEVLSNVEEYIRTPASGELRFRQVSATPVRDEAGQIIGSVTVARDITDRKRAEEELRKANLQLAEADRRKTEFLAMLSHELRNPLAPIRNSIYLLEHAAPGSEQAARAREVVRRQTEHLTRLVDDLLDVTRISHGKIPLERSRVDLREIVRRTTDDLHSVFMQAGIHLRVDHLTAGPMWIDADSTRLAQVLTNLLNNSLKFTPSGGTVRVSVAARDGRAELSVIDDGIGMDPKDIEHMFEPFAQADSSLARTEGGLGLGLALVKSIVELHGGTVAACSEGLGRGSKFLVRMPLRDAAAGPGKPRHLDTGTTPQTILVIEDNADGAQSLADILEMHGHRVRVARDGRSGIALARELQPDVILCDIGLPDVDGYDVARTLRRDGPLREARLIALSGYAQPEDRQRALEAGFDAHLAKPVELDDLLSALNESIEPGSSPDPAASSLH